MHWDRKLQAKRQQEIRIKADVKSSYAEQDGTLTCSFTFPQTETIRDFIIDNSGDLYAFAVSTTETKAQVLDYRQDNSLVEHIPLAFDLSTAADGIMLTADGSLMLVGANTTSWTIRHRHVITPPEIQPLTERDAIPTPRSPTLFRTVMPSPFSEVDPNLKSSIDVLALRGGAVGDRITIATHVETPFPLRYAFANIDRAMNLYVASEYLPPQVDIFRLAPDGPILGGARIDVSQCSPSVLSWRSFYIDQAGGAWALCVTPDGATVSRYTLRDLQGQPLPAAAPEPADVAWKPGANFNSA